MWITAENRMHWFFIDTNKQNINPPFKINNYSRFALILELLGKVNQYNFSNLSVPQTKEKQNSDAKNLKTNESPASLQRNSIEQPVHVHAPESDWLTWKYGLIMPWCDLSTAHTWKTRNLSPNFRRKVETPGNWHLKIMGGTQNKKTKRLIGNKNHKHSRVQI